jgi:tetratricopeptide (TPR) repeat protein
MNRSIVIAAATAALACVSVLTWMQVRQEREFRRLVAAGDAALVQERTSEAIEAFSGAIALKGRSMLAYLKRGETYHQRREFTAALRDLRKASALDAAATRPLELLGDVNAALGRYERATEDYRRYVTLDDRAPRVLYKLALAHFRAGQVRLASDALHKALAIDDRLSEAHYLLGMCLRQTNQRSEARRALMRAVDINPTFAVAREELADLDAALGRRRDGIEQLEALAALEPNKPDRLVQVALAYARLGRREAALVTLGRAAERHPESPLVEAALGRVWLEIAEEDDDADALARALEAIRSATSHGDGSGETLALYGRALLLSGAVSAAERALQDATGRLPVEPSAFRDLASAAERLGHADVARKARANHAELTAR